METKTIFISHSSIDKLIVDSIEELLYCIKDFEVKYNILYSSSNKLGNRFDKGEDIGIRSIEASNECDIFIAYISEDYKKSSICMSELGCGFYRFINNKDKENKNFFFLPIKDDYVQFNDLPLLLLNKIINQNSYDELKNIITDELKLKFDETKKDKIIEIKEKLNEKYNGKDYNLNLSKNQITDYIENTFNCTSLLSQNPFVQYVNRQLYNELHINLTKFGDEHLIWSAYKNPLDVEGYLLDEDNLTSYDKEFAKAKSRNKKRLLIFKDNKDFDSFENPTEQKKKDRKNAFVKINSGCLYYCYEDKIITEFKNSKKKISQTKEHIESETTEQEEKKSNKNELYWEFAYLKSISKHIELMTFSDFDNSQTSVREERLPLFFLHPKDDKVFNYIRKINQSFNLNKFIVRNFKELQQKEIIIKY